MKSKKIIGAAILSIAATNAVAANDWYPASCHSIQLCAPVLSMSWVEQEHAGAATLLVSSMYGKAVVANDVHPFKSQDERVHVCLQYDPFGTLQVTCLLVPARLF